MINARGALVAGLVAIVVSCDGDGNVAPVITTTPPSTAIEHTRYIYSPAHRDADGPSATWELTGGHTCGGAIDAATGVVNFTPQGPMPPASCELAIVVCDGAVSEICTAQTATIAITAVNDAPKITSTPAGATEDTPFMYVATRTDGDGPGQTWSLLGAHTCGGSIVAATGVLTFTPAGPTPPATCELAIQICDGGTVEACATQTQSIPITTVNDAPTITSTAPTTATENATYTYNAVGADPDGTGQTWSTRAAHTCGGTITATTGVFTMTPMGLLPPASCVLDIEVCDGLTLCGTQTTPITIAATDDPPMAVNDGPLAVEQDGGAATLNVLVNDLDSDNGPKTIAMVTQPANGVATITNVGTRVSYTPAPGYCNSQVGGTLDSFTYQLAPGGSLATVNVEVTCTFVPVAVVAGGLHTCALSGAGVVKCWGYNGFGQLGIGTGLARGGAPLQMGANLPRANLGTARTAIALAAGLSHTCAVLDDSTVKCWGGNFIGQLGQGDDVMRGDEPNEMGDALPTVSLGTGRRAISLVAGDYHVCALLDDATVKCWGDNRLAQLGLGDGADRGDGPGEMGDSLPTVALGTGRTAIALTAGKSHTCALLDDATIKCWGQNTSGQLGLGAVDNKGDSPTEMGDALPAVALGTGRTAIAIAAGAAHTCALLDDLTVKCWGYNFLGQLGQGDAINRGDGPGEMGNNLPAISLGTGRTAIKISTGDAHVCAVLDDATLKCWGSNQLGALGVGDSIFRGDGPGEMGDNLPAAALGTGRTPMATSVGGRHTCTLRDNATIACWGQNLEGQLGIGDTDARGDGPNEMGNNLRLVDL